MKNPRKRSNSFSIKDLHVEHAEIDGVKETAVAANNEEVSSIYNEEFRNKLATYNENLQNLDIRYKKLTPLKKLVVRMFTKALVSETGLILPDKVAVRNSQGHMVGEIDNPYPYSKKGVVVAKPEHIENISVGDIIVMNTSPVVGQELSGNEGYVLVRNGFIHPDNVEKYHRFPTDPEDENYGYLLVEPYDVEFIL